ncbi:hypothetical protein FEF34_40010 [Streptomyces marianii]|uniref:Uncharacterized protein n=1 Tax=Streptomyces marianii TaxID=1817406 RepID=A0A5R9DTI9_9ACTN|nr:hypothetical protein FEF34_40010 [Streptomyces marianii]
MARSSAGLPCFELGDFPFDGALMPLPEELAPFAPEPLPPLLGDVDWPDAPFEAPALVFGFGPLPAPVEPSFDVRPAPPEPFPLPEPRPPPPPRSEPRPPPRALRP